MAAKIEIAYFPTIAQLPAWKSFLRTACVDASNRTEEAPVIKWLQEVEAVGKVMTDFNRSGKDFEILDRRLSAALKRICKGEVARTITQCETLAGTTQRVLKGREIYWLILQTFKTNPDMGLVYGITHFTHLKWMGDEMMETFLNNWLEVVNLQGSSPGNNHLAELLRDLMEKSDDLKNDLADFKRNSYLNPDRSKDYDNLLYMLRRHISTKKMSKNNTELCQAIAKAGKSNGTFATPVNGGNGAERKEPCRTWAAGQGCRFGNDCKFYHDKKVKQETQEKGKGSKGSKGSPKGEGKGARSPSPTGEAKTQCCFRFNMDSCTKTKDECHFEHRKIREDEKGAFENYKKMVAARTAKKVLAAVPGDEEETPKLSKKAKAKAKKDAEE